MAMKDYLLQCKPAATGPLFTFANGKWLSCAPLTKELRSTLQHCSFPAESTLHTASVLVQPPLQQQPVFLPGLSRSWAAGAQTVMKVM